jgi:hypothetical protein
MIDYQLMALPSFVYKQGFVGFGSIAISARCKLNKKNIITRKS